MGDRTRLRFSDGCSGRLHKKKSGAAQRNQRKSRFFDGLSGLESEEGGGVVEQWVCVTEEVE